MGIYRESTEAVTGFIEGLVTAAQKQRVSKGLTAAAREKKLAKLDLTSRAIQQFNKYDVKAMRLLHHGDLVVVMRQHLTMDVLVRAACKDGRKASKTISEFDLADLEYVEIVNKVADTIRELDRELGCQSGHKGDRNQ